MVQIPHEALYVIGGGVLGWSLGHLPLFWQRWNPFRSPTPPLLSESQSVTVTFVRDGVEVSHMSYLSSDITQSIVKPKNGPPKEVYVFSHVDHKGRFIYNFAHGVE